MSRKNPTARDVKKGREGGTTHDQEEKSTLLSHVVIIEGKSWKEVAAERNARVCSQRRGYKEVVF